MLRVTTRARAVRNRPSAHGCARETWCIQYGKITARGICMGGFTICTAYRVLFGGQMKADEMKGGACGSHRERREMNTR